MDELRRFRLDRMRARWSVAERRYQEARDRRSSAIHVHYAEPTEENRRRILDAVRATIEALEEVYSLELHIASLGKGIDPQWDREAEEGISGTSTRLVLNYTFVMPSSGYGFTLDDL